MQAIIDMLKSEKYPLHTEDLQHISPYRYNHINKHGRFSFDLSLNLGEDNLRPLRMENSLDKLT